ncbi:ABC transporter substrate-binding protein [Pusillimonas sp. SM2304]|uniref:ABC transporter substrate-binding protein n=1 Tax=Pusillimonas sp. SM2304 TaxID=3073241 RepID=UPI0028771BCA|nr:ABC transporter substrate-binding protein [Pusillimonas sp. SM2304]MDS1140118.1 ABC transporter substrate-binding protein [Pusillimonas sp. SM2304]
MIIKKLGCIFIMLGALTCSGAQAQKTGGSIDIAMPGEPPTLDPMASLVTSLYTITQHYFEMLYNLDENQNVVPGLAKELPEISSDGLTYTIPLREGVPFHDGQVMEAADVVASLKRWMTVATKGKDLAQYISDVSERDNHTVVIKLSRPYSPLLVTLAHYSNTPAVIMPRDNVDMPLKRIIGTGPYKLKDYKPDQYIQLEKFKDYRSPTGPASACSGEVKQYLDEIRFRPIPDVSTRVEGIIAGQYQYADQLPVELFKSISENANVEPVFIKHGFQVLMLNVGAGVLSDIRLRKAVLASLNMEDMLIAAFGTKDFYSVDGALFPKGSPWYTSAGVSGNYNQGDIEKAQKLLKEAGYDGTPIRILTSRQYDHLYKMTQVAAEYMKAAGFNVDLQVMDWASLSQRRADPKLWDIFATFIGYQVDPSGLGVLNPKYLTGWASPEKDAAVSEFLQEPSLEKRVKIYEKIQTLLYNDVPMIKVGNFTNLAARSPKLTGAYPGVNTCFGNASLE